MYIWHNITGSLKCSIPFAHVYSLFLRVYLSVRSSSSFLDQLGQLVIASIRSAAGNACYREQISFFLGFRRSKNSSLPGSTSQVEIQVDQEIGWLVILAWGKGSRPFQK